MYSYATRGLGFLVRCATISRQLGQGRQRSGGSPLFMLNICLVIIIIGASRSEPHTTEFYAFLGILLLLLLLLLLYICIRTTSDEVRMRQMFHVKHGVDAPPTMRSPKKKKAKKSMLRHSYRYQRVFSS